MQNYISRPLQVVDIVKEEERTRQDFLCIAPFLGISTFHEYLQNQINSQGILHVMMHRLHCYLNQCHDSAQENGIAEQPQFVRPLLMQRS